MSLLIFSSVKLEKHEVIPIRIEQNILIYFFQYFSIEIFEFFAPKIVKIEFLFLFFLRHFWSIFRQFEQFVSKDFTGFLKKKWKIEHERKKYILALAK